MSKQNQWLAWIGVTGVLLWFLFKPKKAVSSPTAGPGSSFAVPQTGAAITNAGAAQAARNNSPLSGSPLAGIPGLQNILSGIQSLFKGGSGSKPTINIGGGGHSDPTANIPKLPRKPVYPPPQDNTYPTGMGTDPTDNPDLWGDGSPSFDGYLDPGGELMSGGSFGPSESPWTDPGGELTTEPTYDPGGELSYSGDSAPMQYAEEPDPGFSDYFDVPNDSFDNSYSFDSFA